MTIQKKKIQNKISCKMWHEARKHEKKIRGIMVDHKRRAERRNTYYDKIVRCKKKINCFI